MKLQIFLALQLFFNGALSGHQWTNNIDGRNTNRNEWILLILSIFFGLEMIIISIVWVNLEQFWEWFGGVTQWQFYYQFYCTKKYDKVEEEQWMRIDIRYEAIKNKKDSKQKIALSSQEFLICTELLYKRHNHIRKTKEEYDSLQKEIDRKAYEKDILIEWKDSKRVMLPCCTECDMLLRYENNNCDWCGNEATYATKWRDRNLIK